MIELDEEIEQETAQMVINGASQKLRGSFFDPRDLEEGDDRYELLETLQDEAAKFDLKWDGTRGMYVPKGGHQ